MRRPRSPSHLVNSSVNFGDTTLVLEFGQRFLPVAARFVVRSYYGFWTAIVTLSDVRTPPELIWIGNTPGVAIFGTTTLI